jgi:hypothetical protein
VSPIVKYLLSVSNHVYILYGMIFFEKKNDTVLSLVDKGRIETASAEVVNKNEL